MVITSISENSRIQGHCRHSFPYQSYLLDTETPRKVAGAKVEITNQPISSPLVLKLKADLGPHYRPKDAPPEGKHSMR